MYFPIYLYDHDVNGESLEKLFLSQFPLHSWSVWLGQRATVNWSDMTCQYPSMRWMKQSLLWMESLSQVKRQNQVKTDSLIVRAFCVQSEWVSSLSWFIAILVYHPYINFPNPKTNPNQESETLTLILIRKYLNLQILLLLFKTKLVLRPKLVQSK